MKKLLALALFLNAVLIVGQLAQPSRAAVAVDGVRQTSKIRRLLIERRDIFLRVEDSLKALLQQGRANPKELHRAVMSRLDVEQQLVSSREERLAILGKKVEEAKRQERIMLTLFERGRMSEFEALNARAARLEAEIELERGKARG